MTSRFSFSGHEADWELGAGLDLRLTNRSQSGSVLTAVAASQSR